MTFALHDHWVWDFWLADDGDRFHLYYLHAPKALGDPALRHRNAAIGHATSLDLVEWEDHGPVLGPGHPDGFDGTATWTGSVVRGPDGLWRMFYTGSRFESPTSNANVETIGMASSADLHTWVKAPEVIVRADPRWYETIGDGTWREEAWRDPWVFADPAGDGWHMLVTARAKHGDGDDRGVVGHATSADLRDWEVGPPLSKPGAGFMHVEVPQVTVVDGRVLLLFSCAGSELAAARAGGTGGIWALEPQALAGPFDLENARLLSPETRYSGRAVRDRDGAWVLLAFENGTTDGDFVGVISNPIGVAWSDDGPLLLAPEGVA